MRGQLTDNTERSYIRSIELASRAETPAGEKDMVINVVLHLSLRCFVGRCLLVSGVDALMSRRYGGVQVGKELGGVAVVEVRRKLGIKQRGHRSWMPSIIEEKRRGLDR